MIGPSSIFGGHEMHRAAMDAHARVERAPMRVEPLKDGSRAGWMLISRPCHFSTNGVGQDAHVAGQADDVGAERRAAPRRSPRHAPPCSAKSLRAITCVRDAARGGDRQAGASGWSEMTPTISAGKAGSDAASISAAMFEPRPEIRIAVRLAGVSRS